MNGGGFSAGARWVVLPPISIRTLHHPSFQPLYGPAGSPQNQRRETPITVHPITTEELFYTDPSLGCGGRIPNNVTSMRVFDSSRLNTPRPIMSACVAAPNPPHPFRSGPHPTGNPGSPGWGTPRGLVLLRLTREEDEAVTALLTLPHRGAPRARGGSVRGGWTEAELEAARTLSGFDEAASRSHGDGRHRNVSQEDAGAAEPGPSVPEDCWGLESEVRSTWKERMLTDLEGDVAHTLLSLWDIRGLDVLE
ncbi:unnamed protein product [Menidia menidia]|uniref:(Atlantic silverside) hypothetical protein n=1 Tax=Menidia menidia TaxID=238744 RepID=A0A8S4BFQ1_9TELE|nr:unnamed protein product [Menidia menidia]